MNAQSKSRAHDSTWPQFCPSVNPSWLPNAYSREIWTQDSGLRPGPSGIPEPVLPTRARSRSARVPCMTRHSSRRNPNRASPVNRKTNRYTARRPIKGRQMHARKGKPGLQKNGEETQMRDRCKRKNPPADRASGEKERRPRRYRQRAGCAGGADYPIRRQQQRTRTGTLRGRAHSTQRCSNYIDRPKAASSPTGPRGGTRERKLCAKLRAGKESLKSGDQI